MQQHLKAEKERTSRATTELEKELDDKRQMLAAAQEQLLQMTRTCKALEREIDDVKHSTEGKVMRLENENTELNLQVSGRCVCVSVCV